MTRKHDKTLENLRDTTQNRAAGLPGGPIESAMEIPPEAKASLAGDDQRPTIETARLVLRPLMASDADQIQRLVNDRDVAKTCYSLEYPYPDGLAATWIAAHLDLWITGKSVVFGIDLKNGAPDAEEALGDACSGLVGVIGLEITQADQHAELGYWLGTAHWNQGYTTEAAREVVDFGFEELGLHRIYARHMAGNEASGHVLQKIGMQYEGLLKQHVRKWGRFKDVVCYGMLNPGNS